MHPNVHGSTIYNSQVLGNNLSAHQHMSGSKNYGTFTQWNFTQPEKEGAYTLCNGMDGTGEHYAM